MGAKVANSMAKATLVNAARSFRLRALSSKKLVNGVPYGIKVNIRHFTLRILSPCLFYTEKF